MCRFNFNPIMLMSKKETEVILTENVVSLGAAEGDVVKVKPGYARNFLLPQGKAIPASAGNQRYIESLQSRRAEREATERQHMEELRDSLKSLRLHVKVKTGEGGKMFGSVTAGTICDELHNQFDLELDRKKVALVKPLRELGEFDVKLKLHTDLEGELKVFVESENPLPTPQSVADEEAAKKAAAEKATE